MAIRQARYNTLVGLKVSRELADEIRRLAREEDRTLSAYLRRLVTQSLRQQPHTPQPDDKA